jgi:mannose-6-phosphate isomerase-like protein (cupin superfamily)
VRGIGTYPAAHFEQVALTDVGSDVEVVFADGPACPRSRSRSAPDAEQRAIGETVTTAFALGPDEGVTTRTGPVERIDKITAEDSGGWGFAVETCPPGFETPLHIHHTEDGAFYILEGSLHMQVGEMQVEATPGTFVFLPREVPHAFKVTSTHAARYVNVQGPTGDFQKLMAASHDLLRSSLPPEEITGRQARLSEKYGVEILRSSPGSPLRADPG